MAVRKAEVLLIKCTVLTSKFKLGAGELRARTYNDCGEVIFNKTSNFQSNFDLPKIYPAHLELLAYLDRTKGQVRGGCAVCEMV